jgi:hypothetical protein
LDRENRCERPCIAKNLKNLIIGWIETHIGLQEEPGTGRLKRAAPISIIGDWGAAARLSALTGVAREVCQTAIEKTLLRGF